MKFKTSAIALAVAGTVAAPIAVQAGADELYASARVGLWNVDTGDVSDLSVRSFSSRFGAKGETDLGNGWTGFGRYEWDVDFNADREGGVTDAVDDDPLTPEDERVEAGSGEDDISVRHRYVGVKGDFGSVLVGQTYHTFYNHVVGPLDIPWWHSGYANVEYRGRTDNGITYAGNSGMVSFGVTAYFDTDSEEDSPDVIEVGASFGIGDMTLGLGFITTEADIDDGTGDLIGNSNDEDVIGVALSGIMLGDVGLGISFMNQDDDDGITVDATIGNAYVHLELEYLDKDSPASSSGDDEDRVGITLGYTQSLGRKTTMYYEIHDLDNDTGDSDDDRTAVMAVLKYDII